MFIIQFNENHPYLRHCKLLTIKQPDQDYKILQSPINGSGELISGTAKGDMRLFWAGEHTSLLFPSMAHGALHSGTLAARDVFCNINIRKEDNSLGIDRQIPTSVYRERHPSHPVQCSLCLRPGRKEEGALIAFQHGTRDALVHTRCAEYSPEVSMIFGVWKHVIKAVSRGRKLKCKGCGRPGATIGCQVNSCKENYHLGCCEGWDFAKYGKNFRCALHRPQSQNKTVASCFLCRKNESSTGPKLGRLIGFEKGKTSVMVHSNCMQYTNIVDIKPSDPNDKKIKKVFEAISLSKKCSTCNTRGATIKCFVHHCVQHTHFLCCVTGGWDFITPGPAFFCPLHRITIPGPISLCGSKPTQTETHAKSKSKKTSLLQKTGDKKAIVHNLFYSGTQTVDSQSKDGDSGHGAKSNPHSTSNSEGAVKTEVFYDASKSDESDDELETFNLSDRASSLLRMISGYDKKRLVKTV